MPGGRPGALAAERRTLRGHNASAAAWAPARALRRTATRGVHARGAARRRPAGDDAGGGGGGGVLLRAKQRGSARCVAARAAAPLRRCGHAHRLRRRHPPVAPPAARRQLFRAVRPAATLCLLPRARTPRRGLRHGLLHLPRRARRAARRLGRHFCPEMPVLLGCCGGAPARCSRSRRGACTRFIASLRVLHRCAALLA